MYKNLYNAVNYLIKENCPTIKYVAYFRDQYYIPKENRTFPFPSVLIEIHPCTLSNMGQGVKRTDLRFTLHLAQEIPIPLEKNEKLLQTALNQLGLVDDLRCAIDDNQFASIPIDKDSWVNFGTFRIVGFENLADHYDLYITKLDFEVQMTLGFKEPEQGVMLEYIKLTGSTF